MVANRTNGSIFFLVIAIVIIAAIVGGYFVLFPTGNSQVQINKTISVNGNSQNQTLVLSNQSVSVITNYKSITMVINTTSVVPVDIIGHNNAITIVNGKVNLYVS